MSLAQRIRANCENGAMGAKMETDVLRAAGGSDVLWAARFLIPWRKKKESNV